MIKKYKNYWISSSFVIASFLALICFSGQLSAIEKEPLPEHLKLKTVKENLLGNKVFKDKDNVEVVKYAYKADQIVDLPNEVKERRTKHSRTFIIKNSNQYKTEIISGVPQYYKDPQGNWWQAEYATTTQEAFDEQTKLSFFERLIGRVYATENTFYPDPDTETSTVDGYALHQLDAPGSDSWSNLTGGAGTDASDADAQDAGVVIRSGTQTNYYRRISRVIMLFDTSAIPDADDISSATLSIYGTNKVDDNSIAPDINIYGSNPASNTGLAAGDYDSLGSTAFSTAITYASWNTAGFNNFILNSSGLAAISKTGVTKLGARNANYDIAGIDPDTVGWANDSWTQFNQNFAEAAGTSNDPKLVVFHGICPPVISNLDAINIASTTASISWATDTASDSKIWYSSTTPIGDINHTEVNDTSTTTSHSLNMSNLVKNTVYYYIAVSDNTAGTAGGVSTSSEQQFITSGHSYMCQ